MFADDTTLSSNGCDVDGLISSFKSKLEPFLEWVKYNKLVINWDKTKFMFLSKKKQQNFPNKINVDGNDVEVVKVFKLLGILIDNDLHFHNYVRSIKSNVNKKLFSIKKLFFLSKNVKVQFFKTFIMPHFEYCVALSVYLTKTQIESLEKFYNVCLFRLLNIRLFGLEIDEQYKILEEFNLLPFRMRLFVRLSKFCHKVLTRNILVRFHDNLKFKSKSFIYFLKNKSFIYFLF